MRAQRLVAVSSTGQVSGAERVLVRTLAAAVDAGWEVACACPDGPLAREVAATGARHLVIPEQHLAGGPRPVAVVRTLARWVRAARVLRGASRGADVVLANALLSLPALRLASPIRSTVPAAWLAHDVVVSPSRLRLYRWCSPALSRVVAVSEAVAQRLRLAGGPRVDVVHNGVEFPVPPAAPAADDLPVVGLNALLTPWKGQHVLLDAVGMLEVPARVELMGGHLPTDAAYAAGVRARVGDGPLAERVSVVGHQADPVERMRGWTVAVSASTDPEACPLAVLEAMSIGVPVVASDHGGAPEVLGGAGVLVRPGDARDLADAITLLLDDPDLRRRTSAAGRERVALGHRLDRQTTRLLEVLDDLATTRRTS